MKLKQDLFYPCLWGTQISPNLAKIGHLTSFALKNDVNRSIIGKNSPFNTIRGYSDFNPLDPTHIQRNPIILTRFQQAMTWES
ncbi:hypothetical protein H5410_051059 [Solanum commersonii]|uniref:Uncharacterized protein n=1 Tax=Solanum commersonii TaxID=4109 RepID=A0A9J5WZU1_SOLCO|nr:hypothetical protein H5410_051059 [Solanum commersonii]